MRRRLSAAALLLVLLTVSIASGGTISVPFSFSPNTTIQSSQVNSNFNTVYNLVNGGIDDANISSITETKLVFTGTGHDHSGGAKGAFVAMPVVNGRLAYVSATQIKLAPFQGNRLYLKKSGVWTATTIASTGITANNTSIFIDGTGSSNLAASTLYYVYLFDNSGTTTVDFSTTGHATDAATGVEIKSGVDTRVLVGMVRTNGSSQFSSFLVLSYHNRAVRNQLTSFSADRSTASATYVELNTEIQNTFLTWGDEAVFTSLTGGTQNNTATARNTTALAFDGTTAENGFESMVTCTTASNDYPLGISGYKAIAEGYHYVTVLGAAQAGTAQWAASTTLGTKTKVVLHVGVRG